MCAPASVSATHLDIQRAVRQLGAGALSEAALIDHIWPLFARVRERAQGQIYLANHSLGRPLDQTALDVQEGLRVWYEKLDDAWDDWLLQRQRFREQVASLIHAVSGDSIVPRASAGQGLRTVLSTFDRKIRIVTSANEFDSVDFLLKVYARRDRISLTRVAADERGYQGMQPLVDSIDDQTDLVVVSLVLFVTGQWLSDIRVLIEAAHCHGARVLLDLYHAAGVLPVNVQALNADFAVGGCYKYLRGGPGAAWLFIHPRHLDGSLRSLDCGWFAQSEPFAFERHGAPGFAGGGNAFLEATPAVLPFYQARAGLEFTLAMGVERLRAYSLEQQCRLNEMLLGAGIEVFDKPSACGAFVAIPDSHAREQARRLRKLGVRTDAREGYLRLCPDILNTEAELEAAVRKLAGLR